MSIVEMEVRMDCNGCERKVRKALSKLEGVDAIDIDIQQQKVTVTGYADQMTVLDVVRSTGKKAEFWPYPYDSHYLSYGPHYHYQQISTPAASTYNYETQYHYQQISTPAASTYNYETHGYNNGTVDDYYHSELPSSSAVMNDKAASLFSDENPHACSVM